MNLRQQIIEDHVDKTALILGKKKSEAFEIFGHCLYLDKSIHSFDENDIVDGGQDKQIDIISIEEGDDTTIYISQVKYEKSFSSNSIIQIGNGLKWIFEKEKADVESLDNLKFKDKIYECRELISSLGPSNITLKLTYITNGLSSEFSDEAKQERKTIIDKFDNGVFASFSFDIVGCDELVDILSIQEKKNKKINCDLKILYDANNPSLIKYHSKGMTGIICSATAKDVAEIVNEDAGGFIFDLNIRKYLGRVGGVNRDILNTCTDDKLSHLFWFLNNGVTIVCDKVEPITDPDDAKVKIYNMQIVNGCQTATSLANAFKEGHLQDNTRVLLRIYQTSDLDLVDKIVLTTNNQNAISGRNLRANDQIQLDLERGLRLYDYYMERKPRQYETTEISKEKIIPNDIIAVAYLAIVLKRPSDARSRKYKVWSELYRKIFKSKSTIEPYLLSVLIYKKVNAYLKSVYGNDPDLTYRYLAKNASLHISRIVSYLWRGSDVWTNIPMLVGEIEKITSDKPEIEDKIEGAMAILHGIVDKEEVNMNNALKSFELDREINKQLNIQYTQVDSIALKLWNDD